MVHVERLGIIIKPDPSSLYEKVQTFNPGVYYDEKSSCVHIFPRAQSSYIPYVARIMWYIADLREGLDGLRRPRKVKNHPVLGPSDVYDWSGTEDPRIVKINIGGEDYLIMTYTAVETFHPLTHRVGVACAKAKDVEDMKEDLTFVSIGTVEYINDKDAFYFVTKDGQLYYIHRPIGVYPRACIWVSDLDKEGVKSLTSPSELLLVNNPRALVRAEYWWENSKIGAGAPPIETEDGYLWIYHGVQRFGMNYVYRAGVFLTDLKDPLKIIARSPDPLLEPKEPYEKWLDVPFVIFPTGAFVFDEHLVIIYGACDTVVAAAKVRLDELLSELDRHRVE
ncbi:MAG: hypothetical protein DRN15_08645 [Thermoprotei archaeon]|nr:MAG: hypothetical protein DRM97_07060 [Thermoprotei archaeon]RLF22569.1 MAG: hypothetical protein DRN15_08645 [Thermoprotei archaeon]